MKEKKPPFATTELVYGQFYTLSWPASEMGIRLIDKILNICICNNMSDTPPSFFIYLHKLKQKINGHLDEYSDETEIDQAVHQLRTRSSIS